MYIYSFLYIVSFCLLEMEEKRCEREEKRKRRKEERTRINEKILLHLPNDSFDWSKLAGRIALNIKILSHINTHRIASKSR